LSYCFKCAHTALIRRSLTNSRPASSQKGPTRSKNQRRSPSSSLASCSFPLLSFG
jgi:hypothetical protein